MDMEISSAQKGLQANCGENDVDLDERLHEMIAVDSLHFDSWTILIAEIEKVHSDNINMLSLAYDNFLPKFPLCHWYWTKYANHKARLCTVDEAVDIFERAVESTTFSVGFWLNYCTFGESFFKDPSDIRRVYERAFSFIGKDYNCHVLWDKYLRFEFSQQQWSRLAHIYIRVLKFPSKGLSFYYDNFQKFVTVMEEEIKGEDDSNTVVDPDDIPIIELMKSKDELSRIIKDLQDLSDPSRRSRALHKYNTIGNKFYQKALKLDKEIKTYEAKIQTNYFQERLIDDEIRNWHQYLDFIEKQKDFDWALKLYERCLISCAKYPEFWMRYVEFMETRRGRPLAVFALDRATEVFLKEVPQIHLFSARFKEQIGDLKGACDAYHSLMGSNEFLEYVVRQANMEKRRGNLLAASEIYEKTLKTAVEQQKVHLLPSLYIHFYRLKYMITGNVDEAIDVIINGLQQIPYCRFLLEELINFAMSHDGARCISVIDSIVSKAISPTEDPPSGFDMKDKVDISCLYLEFVDLCGTVDDIKKAWSRHNQLFPQLLRPDSSTKQLALRSKSSLNEMTERRENNLCTMHEHPVQVREPLQLINHSSKANQVSEDKSLQQSDGNDSQEKRPEVAPQTTTKVNQVSEGLSLQQGDGNASPEKRSRLSLEVAPRTTEHAIELGGLNQYSGLNKPTTDDASGRMKSAPDIEANSASMETNHVLIEQHIKNSSTPTLSTDKYAPSETFSGSLQHLSCSVDNHQDLDNKVERGPKMDSSENHCLDSEEKKPLELINKSAVDEMPAAKVECSLEGQVRADPQTIKHSSTSDSPITSPPNPSDWQHGSYVSKHDGPLSSGHRENHILEQDYHRSSRSSSPGGNSHLASQGVELENRTFRNHADSHAQQQHSQMTSSRQQYVSGEMGRERPKNHRSSYRRLASSKASRGRGRYHPGVAKGNAENSHAWSVNNVPQQTAVSANQSQPSSSTGYHPQSNMSYCPTDVGQQTVMPQNQEAVNQMMQYQYYQQQQMMQQYEQQMLQIQQQYSQHQQQLQPQQDQSQTSTPLLEQQQYVQQQQQLQSLQQQISYWQNIQQQPSQTQVHHYHQADGHDQQMYQSGSQQQADQGYQLLWQQYQLQQQGYYYMMQQHQQQQQQQEEQQEGSNNQMQQEGPNNQMQQQEDTQDSSGQQQMDVE